MYNFLEDYIKKYKKVENNKSPIIIFAERIVNHELKLNKGIVFENISVNAGISISNSNFFYSESKPSEADNLLDKKDCVDIMIKAEQSAWTNDASIIDITTSLVAKKQLVYIYNSLINSIVTDCRYRTRLFVEVKLKKFDREFIGFAGPGLSLPANEYMKYIVPSDIGKDATHRALTFLYAKPLNKEENLPVILSNGYGGILFHEACGHCLEADKRSPLDKYIGKKINFNALNVYDDPTCNLSWGNYKVDDEGFPAKKNFLIEDGVIVNKIHNLSTCQENIDLLGHARRENFQFLALPRMSTITIMNNTDCRNNNIIEDTKKGIFVKYALNGFVDIKSGNFSFPVIEGYWITNGKLSQSISNASITGNCIDVLRNIDFIGNDIRVKSAICCKDSQHIETSLAQPTIRINTLKIVLTKNDT
jgi:TldD protein